MEFLEEELGDSLIANDRLCQEVEENSKLYLGEPKTKTKDFPWRNASNLVIPLVGITVDSVLARVVNTIFGVEPFWTVTSGPKQLGLIHKDIETFMDWSAKTELKLYKQIKSWSLETVLDGWSWLKAYWEIVFHQRFENGRWVLYPSRQPKVCHIPLIDILPQYGVDNEKEGDFFAQRVRWTDANLRRKSEKVYSYIEEVIANKDDQNLRRQAYGLNEGVVREKVNTAYECWIDWAFGAKKSIIAPIVVTYHAPTRKIMRAMHNPLHIGQRPFIKGRFVEIRGQAKGLGLARQLKSLQAEISTIHNQQVDNATLANTRFFIGKRGQIKSDTRVWPGKVILTQDPGKDFIPMQLGEVYNSMKSLEITAMSYAERRSGVSDYTLGRESTVIGDRATATGTLAILQEGNRRFDLNVRDLRDSLQDLGYLLLELNHQYRPRGMATFLQGSSGESVEVLLDLPPDFSAASLGLELTASTGTINRQVEQAGLLQFLGVLTQNLQLGQQAAFLLGNPEVPAMAKEYTMKAMEGITNIVKRIAQTFDQRNSEDLVPTLQAYEGLQNLAGRAQQAGVPGVAGGANGSQPSPILAETQGTA